MMNTDIRSESRSELLQKKKQKPKKEIILQLHKLIDELPTQTDGMICETLRSIMVFIIHFDYNFFDSLSDINFISLINLIPFQPMREKPNISYLAVDMFTLLLKNNPNLIDSYMNKGLFDIIISNMMYVIDNSFYISCVDFLYEALKIRNDLREYYISFNLHDSIMRCTPYPDKVFFEFLTLLSLKPTFSMDLASAVIPTFIAQDIPPERTGTVLKCMIYVIKASKEIIAPIIFSDFLERTIASLGSSIYTNVMFFKFSKIALSIGEPAVKKLQKINIYEILRESLQNFDKSCNLSFNDMIKIALKNEKNSGILSPDDLIIKHACNLLNELLKYDSCLQNLLWIENLNFEELIQKELPFQTKLSVIRVILGFIQKAPKESCQGFLLNEAIMNSIFLFASSEADNENENDSPILNSLNQILNKFSDNKDIIAFIESINNFYPNIVLSFPNDDKI